MQTIPNDIITDVLTYAPLGDVYAYCQSVRGTYQGVRTCKSGRVWARLGSQRHPKLTLDLRASGQTSIGRIYHRLARLIYAIRSYLEIHDRITIMAENVTMTDSMPHVDQTMRFLFSQADLSITITHLANHRYAILVAQDEYKEYQSKIVDLFYVSSDQLAEYMISLTISSQDLDYQLEEDTTGAMDLFSVNVLKAGQALWDEVGNTGVTESITESITESYGV